MNKAVKLLCEKNYVYEDGKHLYLTEEGKVYASAVYEKHCIIRDFLIRYGRFPRGGGNGRLQNGTSRRRRNFRDDEKMRRKKIIAFCRRLLADLQTREKKGRSFLRPFCLFLDISAVGSR